MDDSKSFYLRRPVLAAALLAAAVTFIIYIPALQNGFVNWDDTKYVPNNLIIRSFDLKAYFTAVIMGSWVPLAILSYGLDYAVWKLDPFGYHLTNIIIHSLNTFLLALISARLLLLREKGLSAKGLFLAALIPALFFGIHPIHVESVAWVAERKDVLSTLFFLLGVMTYAGYATGRSKAANYALTLVFLTLGLLAKPMLVTMPVVFLILDFYPFERLSSGKWKTALVEKLPMFLLCAGEAMLTVWSQKIGNAVVAVERLTLADRVYNSARGFLWYIYKLLAPVNLAPFYPYYIEPILSVRFFVFLSILAAVTVLAISTLRNRKYFAVSWAFYIVTLLPVIGIVQVGAQAAADRYMYIPSIPFFMLAGAGAGLLVSRRRESTAIVAAVVIAVAAVYSYLSVKQIAIWRTSIALWTHEISVYPESVRGYSNLGNAYGKIGDYERAIAELRKAIEVAPSMQDLYSDIGLAYSQMGRDQEAVENFTRAINFDPSLKGAYKSRGFSYAKMADYGKAFEDFRKYVELSPVDPAGHLNMGLIYMKLGENEKAAASFEKARELGDTDALTYLRQLENQPKPVQR